MTTRVIFRVFKGEVLALFPAIATTFGKPWRCESYSHIGQHSAAVYRVIIADSRPAKPAEYRDLAAELRRIGYKLKIAKRATAADETARREQLAR